MQHEPTRFEVCLTKLAFLLFGKSVYRTYSDRLPLVGNERVLDFGCGMGTVAFYAAKRLPHGSLTCLDISERWLNACRKTLRGLGNVTFIRQEAPALAEDSFHVVYCHFVLHDLTERDMETVVPALVKALTTGGTLLFREPLNQSEKLIHIRRLIDQSKLTLKESRVIDVPLMGNALESVYIKGETSDTQTAAANTRMNLLLNRENVPS